jgi:hypothetical protein
VFDPLAAATVAADLAVSGLLRPERAARLVEFHTRDARNPDFTEVVDRLLDRAWGEKPTADGRAMAVAQAVQRLVVTRLIDLASNEAASGPPRAVAAHALRGLLRNRLALAPDVLLDAHRAALRDEIERFLRRPDPTQDRSTPPATPPGDPIGSSRR